MAHTATNTILVKVYSDVRGEATGAETILPGHILQLLSGGTVQKNDGVNIGVEGMIAIEDELQGRTIDQSYASVKTFFAILYPGDEVVGRLANGQTAVIGSKLSPTTGGEVKVTAVDSSAIILEEQAQFIALEAVDMSDSSAADPDGKILMRKI